MSTYNNLSLNLQPNLETIALKIIKLAIVKVWAGSHQRLPVATTPNAIYIKTKLKGYQ